MRNPEQHHHPWSLERQRLELSAEARGTGNPQERATTRRQKYDGKPLIHVVAMNGLQYDPDDLHELLPPLPFLLPRNDRTGAGGETPAMPGGPQLKLTRAGFAVWNGKDVKLTEDGRIDRSASLVRIARIGLKAGLTHEQLVAVLAERDEALAALGQRGTVRVSVILLLLFTMILGYFIASRTLGFRLSVWHPRPPAISKSEAAHLIESCQIVGALAPHIGGLELFLRDGTSRLTSRQDEPAITELIHDMPPACGPRITIGIE